MESIINTTFSLVYDYQCQIIEYIKLHSESILYVNL